MFIDRLAYWQPLISCRKTWAHIPWTSWQIERQKVTVLNVLLNKEEVKTTLPNHPSNKCLETFRWILRNVCNDVWIMLSFKVVETLVCTCWCKHCITCDIYIEMFCFLSKYSSWTFTAICIQISSSNRCLQYLLMQK